MASAVLLSPSVEVWLLLQLGLLLGGHHQHRVSLATVFRVIWVFSLNRYINNKGRVKEGKGLTATGFDCGQRLGWLPALPGQEVQTTAGMGTCSR